MKILGDYHLISINLRSLIMVIAGLILILCGVLLAFFLIKYQYDFCVNKWTNNLNGFMYKYKTAWDCFIERSTGAIIISIVFGAIPFSIGCFLITRR